MREGEGDWEGSWRRGGAGGEGQVEDDDDILVKNESPVDSKLHDAGFQKGFLLLTPSIPLPSFSVRRFGLRIGSLVGSLLSIVLFDRWFVLDRARPEEDRGWGGWGIGGRG